MGMTSAQIERLIKSEYESDQDIEIKLIKLYEKKPSRLADRFPSGGSILHQLIHTSRLGALKLLLNHKKIIAIAADPDFLGCNILHYLVQREGTSDIRELVDKILDEHPDLVDSPDKSGITPLSLAQQLSADYQRETLENPPKSQHWFVTFIKTRLDIKKAVDQWIDPGMPKPRTYTGAHTSTTTNPETTPPVTTTTKSDPGNSPERARLRASSLKPSPLRNASDPKLPISGSDLDKIHATLSNLVPTLRLDDIGAPAAVSPQTSRGSPHSPGNSPGWTRSSFSSSFGSSKSGSAPGSPLDSPTGSDRQFFPGSPITLSREGSPLPTPRYTLSDSTKSDASSTEASRSLPGSDYQVSDSETMVPFLRQIIGFFHVNGGGFDCFDRRLSYFIALYSTYFLPTPFDNDNELITIGNSPLIKHILDKLRPLVDKKRIDAEKEMALLQENCLKEIRGHLPAAHGPATFPELAEPPGLPNSADIYMQLWMLTSGRKNSESQQRIYNFPVIAQITLGMMSTYGSHTIITHLTTLYGHFDFAQRLSANFILLQLVYWDSIDSAVEPNLTLKDKLDDFQRLNLKFIKSSALAMSMNQLLSDMYTQCNTRFGDPLSSNFNRLSKSLENLEAYKPGFDVLVTKALKLPPADRTAEVAEIAHELNRVTQDFYYQVRLSEFASVKWADPEKAPHIVAQAAYINRLVEYLIVKILTRPHEPIDDEWLPTTNALRLIIELSQAVCLEKNENPDFNILMMLSSILTHSLIDRLAPAFNALTPEESEFINQLQNLTSPVQGNKAAHDYYLTHPFVFPDVSLLLKEVTFAFEGKENNVMFRAELLGKLLQHLMLIRGHGNCHKSTATTHLIDFLNRSLPRACESYRYDRSKDARDSGNHLRRSVTREKMQDTTLYRASLRLVPHGALFIGKGSLQEILNKLNLDFLDNDALPNEYDHPPQVIIKWLIALFDKELTNFQSFTEKGCNKIPLTTEELQTQIEALQAKVEKLRTKINELQIKLEESQTKVEELETKIKKLLTDVEEFQIKFRTLKTVFKSLEGTVLKLIKINNDNVGLEMPNKVHTQLNIIFYEIKLAVLNGKLLDSNTLNTGFYKKMLGDLNRELQDLKKATHPPKPVSSSRIQSGLFRTPAPTVTVRKNSKEDNPDMSSSQTTAQPG